VSILIKDVRVGKTQTHIYIEGERICELGRKREADKIIDGRGLAAMPGFVNTHTHLAMTLFRGYADDLALHEWLNDKIWPLEHKLTKDIVEWGSRFGMLEMIRTGTTTFVEMYFFAPAVARAVKEMGLRAFICEGFIDLGDQERRERSIKETITGVKAMRALRCNRVSPSIGPHAIYTVSKEAWQWCAQYARDEGLLLQYHLSETEKEVKDCQRLHGARPARYLDRIGVLGPRSIAAHGVWLDDAEVALLAKRKVSISNNPASNFKLGVGRLFPYGAVASAKANLTIGTDGAASNNSLDMFSSMKLASLQAKLMNAPTAMDAKTTLDCATLNGAKALGLDAGIIKPGKLADLILVDLNDISMLPLHDLTSNMVYSARASCVHTTICNGQVLMEGGKVKGEKSIIEGFKKASGKLVGG